MLDLLLNRLPPFARSVLSDRTVMSLSCCYAIDAEPVSTRRPGSMRVAG